MRWKSEIFYSPNARSWMRWDQHGCGGTHTVVWLIPHCLVGHFNTWLVFVDSSELGSCLGGGLEDFLGIWSGIGLCEISEKMLWKYITFKVIKIRKYKVSFKTVFVVLFFHLYITYHSIFAQDSLERRIRTRVAGLNIIEFFFII